MSRKTSYKIGSLLMKMTIRNEIFSRETVDRALADYRSILKASVEYGEACSVITFGECRYDEVLTAYELENYMIGIENQ